MSDIKEYTTVSVVHPIFDKVNSFEIKVIQSEIHWLTSNLLLLNYLLKL